MQEQPLKKVLRHLAEEVFPPETDLWPAISTHLSTSHKDSANRGAIQMKPPRIQSNRLRLMALVAAVLLVLTVFAFASPQGQAWAQNIFKFFMQSESDVLVQPTSIPQQSISPATIPQTVKNIKLPTELPAGWKIGAIDTREGDEYVHVGFSYSGKRRTLDLYMQPAVKLAGTIWGPGDEVETVPVGEGTGDYTRGVWMEETKKSFIFQVEPEAAVELQWFKDVAVRRLRWRSNGMLYWLISGGGSPGHPGYLGKIDLIRIAESLEAVSPSADTWPDPDSFVPEEGRSEIVNEVNLDVEAIAAEAGFRVLAPSVLPQSYSFIGGGYYDLGHETWLTFQCIDGNIEYGQWDFTLRQKQISEVEFLKQVDDFRPRVGLSAEIEPVSIGDATGEYVQGGWRPTFSKPESPPMQEVWYSDANIHHMFWYQDGMLFQIHTTRGSFDFDPGKCRLEKEVLVAFAERLK